MDEGTDGDVLLVGLTSIGSVIGDPPKAGWFEWRHLLAAHRCHRLYLIDCFQHWYLGPVLGFSHSVDRTAERILEEKDRLGARRLILVGSSMGGFGALLLGAKTGADLALAIAPQTSVDAPFLEAIGDCRWPFKAAEINNIGYSNRDLVEVYRATGGPRRTRILYDAACSDDDLHATRLAALPNVEIADVGYGGHGCAYEMAKRGELTRIIDAAILAEHRGRPESTRWWQRLRPRGQAMAERT